MIDHPGMFDVPEAEYHKDPVIAPSLSAGIAKLLIARSPLHAWYAHPRLNPDHEEKESAQFDYGAAVHVMTLEPEADRIQLIRHADYRKNEAKAERDSARAAGKIPVLEAQYVKLIAMHEALVRAFSHNPDLAGINLADGLIEKTLIWKRAGAWNRARPDFMTQDRRVVIDLKSTEASANPDAWVRTMMNTGFDIQAAHYLEGNEETGGVPVDEAKWIFAVQEQEPPYAVSFCGLPPEFIAFARQKIATAREMWCDCMESGLWPGYPNCVAWLDVPAWAQSQWEERAPLVFPGEGRGSNDGMERMYGDLKKEVH